MVQDRAAARDYYVRLDGNDYSVDPAVIGRRIEITADLARVKVTCDGRVVADHERIWARHQTLTDPAHLAAAAALRSARRLLAPRCPARPAPRSSTATWPSMTS